MPNITFTKERRERVKATPFDLFNRFYGLFGLVITVALWTACFVAARTHFNYMPALLGATSGFVPGWGLCYGAWVKRLTWTWCIITAFAIVASLVLGFTLMAYPSLMAGCFGVAGGTCLLWLGMTGLKNGVWPNQ